MDFKCAVIICILLSSILVQGQHRQQGMRCLCKKFAKKLDVKRILKLEIYPPGSKCESEEYIATIKRSKGSKKRDIKLERKCVRPDMKQVKAITERKIKKKIPVIKYPSQRK
ncbi:C-X-C motif chemokine 10-like [Mantella aurantiaca]